MRRVALALLLSLGMVSPAMAKDGGRAGSGSAGAQADNLSEAQQYYQRGVAELRSSQNAAAIADFEKSLALDPDRFETYDALGAALSKNRQWATAVQHWDDYIQRHPEDGRAYCERGGAYSWLHDLAHMRADAAKACSLGDQQCCQIAGKLGVSQAPPPAAPSPETPPPAAHSSEAPPPPVPSSEPTRGTGWGLIIAIVYISITLVIYWMVGPKVFFSEALYWKIAVPCTVGIGILHEIHIVKEIYVKSLWFAMFPALAGVLLFGRGFTRYRKFRAILITPESAIHGLAMGFVEVHGKATGAQTVPSPVSKTPCFFYKVGLEGRGKPHGSMGGQSVEFTKVDLGGTTFYLEDTTGKVRVNPAGMECDLLLNKETRFKLTGWGKMNVDDDELIRYANNLARPLDYVSQCHFLEYCVLPGHWYDLAGTCVENPMPQDLLDRNLIVKGSKEPTFLISWRSEKGTKARVGRQAALDIYIGGAIILSGAALGLALAGLL
jgi:hypothetical protein